MKSVQYYFDHFIVLLANYMANEIDELIETEDNIDQLKSYIMSTKSKVEDKNFWFCSGAAWGVTLIKILDDNGFIADGTQSVSDPLTDMVEDFVGIKIP